jgi:hypothetical protein
MADLQKPFRAPFRGLLGWQTGFDSEFNFASRQEFCRDLLSDLRSRLEQRFPNEADVFFRRLPMYADDSTAQGELRAVIAILSRGPTAVDNWQLRIGESENWLPKDFRAAAMRIVAGEFGDPQAVMQAANAWAADQGFPIGRLDTETLEKEFKAPPYRR